MTGYGVQQKEGEAGTQGKLMDQHQEEPSGYGRDLGAGRGGKRGMNGHWTRRQNQACGAGRRGEPRRLVGGGCGKIPGVRLTTPGEEVGIRCT